MFENFINTINYIVNASFFYPAMGLTTATSIFIGAAMYNGDIRSASKGMIVLGSYAGMLLLFTIPRVYEATLINPQHSPHLFYAGIVTILFLTLYYILGMIIGVYTVKKVRER